MLKFRLVFVFCITILSQSIGQNKFYTFYEDCVVRTQPRIKSDPISTIPLKSGLQLSNRGSSKIDTIQGKAGHWLEVNYKGHKGYIWNHLVSDYSFVSHHGELVLLKNTKDKHIHYKVFYGDSLLVDEITSSKLDLEYVNIEDVSPLKGLENHYMVLKFVNKVVGFFSFKNLQLVIDKIPSHHIKSREFKKDSLQIGLVHGNKINVRIEPDITSEVVFQIDSTQFIHIDSIGNPTQLNGEKGKWIKVNKGKLNGYVWGKFIERVQAVFSIENSKEKIFCTEKRLAVFNQSNTLLSQCILSDPDNPSYMGYYDEFRVQIQPNPFYPNNIEEALISVFVHTQEMDVGWSKKSYVLWKDKTLKQVYINRYEGEMGYLNYKNYYPITKAIQDVEQPFIKNSFILNEFIEAYSDAITFKGKQEWESYNRHELYGLIEGSLSKIPSKIDNLEAVLNETWKDYTVQNYVCLDFNKDGVLDVLFCATEIKSKAKTEYTLTDKTLIGYAKATSDSTFEITPLNKGLFKSSHVCTIDLKKEGFDLWRMSWKVNQDTENHQRQFRKYSFKYNTEEDEFILE